MKSYFKDCHKKGNVIIFFVHSMCPKCKVILPDIQSFSMNNEYNIEVFIASDKDSHYDNSVTVFPTFFAYKGGDKVGETATSTYSRFRDFIDKYYN